MTLDEIIDWLNRRSESDFWWVEVDGDVLDEPKSLPQILRLNLRPGRNRVRLLHFSYTDKAQKEWFEFQLPGEGAHVQLADTEPEAAVDPENRRVLAAVIAGALLAALAAFFFRESIIRSIRGKPNRDEVTVTRTLPAMPVSISVDARTVVVANIDYRRSLEDLELSLLLRGDDGFEEVEPFTMQPTTLGPRQVLRAPFYAFYRDGERLSAVRKDVALVRIRAEGFRDARHRPRPDPFRGGG